MWRHERRRSEAKGSVKVLAYGLLVAACAHLVLHTAAFRNHKSITFDETFYLSCALRTVHDGRLDRRLAENGVAPLGVLLSYLPVALAAGGADRPDPWQGQVEDVRLIYAARAIQSLAMGLPLVILVFLLLHRWHGIWAGVAGAWLVAASPTILCHASLATTDGWLCLLFLAAIVVLDWYQREPSTIRLLALALVIAAAVSSKYSGVYLLFVAGGGLLLSRWGRRPHPGPLDGALRAGRTAIGMGALLTVLVLLAAWGLHLFQLIPMPKRTLAETPVFLRPSLVHGVLFQYMHNRAGHHAYLAGALSLEGWRYYFPYALAVKSTLVELATLLTLFPLAAWARWRREPLPSGTWLLILATAVVLAVSLLARINIGHRYVLPLYPLMLTAITSVIWVLGARAPRTRAAVLAGLVTLQVASAFAVSPHFIAYFSPLAGGPRRGAEHLVDSNLDWGQDLPLLREELRRLGFERTLILYFGTASWEAYGVEATSLLDTSPAQFDRYEAVAVSQTFLKGTYSYGRDPFEQLRKLPARGRAGYSIVIYDLEQPGVRDAVTTAWRRGLPRR